MSSPHLTHLSTHGQNLDPPSSPTPRVFTWGLLGVGPHHCVLWSPILILPRAEPNLEMQEPPHPEPEQQCQDGSQLERLFKCHIRLSSHNSCWNLSFSHSFVVNGLGGKGVWKGSGELVAAPHPALPAQPVPPAPCWAASTIPPPLLPWEVFYPNFLLEYLGFFHFSLPSDLFLLILFPCSWEQVASFPSGALSQCEAVAVSVPVPHPHLPHSPSPWLLSPLCFVPHVLGSLCPSVAALLLPPHSCPGQPGVVAVPSPVLACSINPVM